MIFELRNSRLRKLPPSNQDKKMKKYFLFLSLLLMTGGAAYAQGLTLPATSPHEHIRQTVGLTNVDLDFSRPGVKGRKIFGGLLPYDSVWRIGANAATTIEVSDDITFGGHQLKKGKYALFARPGVNSWTILVNGNPDVWGTDYHASETLFQLKAKPENAQFTESLLINLDSLRNDSANLIIQWERTRVSIPTIFPTSQIAMQNIKNATQGTATTYYQAANYLLNNGGDLNAALDYVNKSISLQEGFYNDWVKAQILVKQGNYKDAATLANKAVTLGKAAGTNSNYRFFSDRIEKLAQDLSAKAGGKKK
jgi:hypothetical protein